MIDSKMNLRLSVVFVAAMTIAITAPMALAADPPATQPALAPSADPMGMDNMNAGDPIGRQGGGVRSSRSTSDPAFWISIIAPLRVGKTTLASPSLVFYLSKATDRPVLVTVTEQRNNQAAAVIHWVSDGTTAAGLHEIDLAKMNATLKPNVLYRWTAAVRLDDQNPATQLFSSGLLLRVPAAAALPPADSYDGKAFYDAVAATYSAMIAHGSDPAAPRKALADLLAKVEIKDVSVDVAHDPETPPANGAGTP